MSKLDRILLNFFFPLKNIKNGELFLLSCFDNFDLQCSFIPKREPNFQPSILKRLKGQNHFYGHFHSYLALLISH